MIKYIFNQIRDKSITFPHKFNIKYLFYGYKHLHYSLPRADKSAKDLDSLPENEWNWVPPRDSGNIRKNKSIAYEIPTKKRTLLTTEEVQQALLSMGGENIVVININGSLGSVSNFIIATGRSPRFLRKMSDSIVQAVIIILILHY
jgi:hypothetical protein